MYNTRRINNNEITKITDITNRIATKAANLINGYKRVTNLDGNIEVDVCKPQLETIVTEVATLKNQVDQYATILTPTQKTYYNEFITKAKGFLNQEVEELKAARITSNKKDELNEKLENKNLHPETIKIDSSVYQKFGEDQENTTKQETENKSNDSFGNDENDFEADDPILNNSVQYQNIPIDNNVENKDMLMNILKTVYGLLIAAVSAEKLAANNSLENEVRCANVEKAILLYKRGLQLFDIAKIKSPATEDERKLFEKIEENYENYSRAIEEMEEKKLKLKN